MNDATHPNGRETGSDAASSLGYPRFEKLEDGALVTESALAEVFGKHPVSIRRAVERGELPPPVRLMGKPVWTAGAIRRHLDLRLKEAAKEAEFLDRAAQEHLNR